MASTFLNKEFLFKIIFIYILVIAVQSRTVYQRRPHQLSRRIDDEDLRAALRVLLHGRRALDTNTLAKARFLYKALTRNLLRENANVPEVKETEVGADDAGIAEHELQEAASKNTSALLQRPFVQHKGKNDFLVLKPSAKDPFITVVPNDIYYNIEKRCVNWLDDCNVQGIRARLLQRVQSPYR